MEPRWLTLARSQLGVKEWPGAATNPTVAQYFADAAGRKQPDAVPWCAAFANAMLERAGVRGTRALWARGFLSWGIRLSRPIPGAIAVWARGSGGHVAFVESASGGVLTVIGGNQSNAVTRARRGTAGLLGYRWPSGVPLPSGKAYKLKGIPRTEAPMADMTPQQILDTLSQLYGRIDGMGFSEVRPAVKKAISCMFYLTKQVMALQGQPIPKSLKLKRKPAPKRKRK